MEKRQKLFDLTDAATPASFFTDAISLDVQMQNAEKSLIGLVNSANQALLEDDFGRNSEISHILEDNLNRAAITTAKLTTGLLPHGMPPICTELGLPMFYCEKNFIETITENYGNIDPHRSPAFSTHAIGYENSYTTRAKMQIYSSTFHLEYDVMMSDNGPKKVADYILVKMGEYYNHCAHAVYEHLLEAGMTKPEYGTEQETFNKRRAAYINESFCMHKQRISKYRVTEMVIDDMLKGRSRTKPTVCYVPAGYMRLLRLGDADDYASQMGGEQAVMDKKALYQLEMVIKGVKFLEAPCLYGQEGQGRALTRFTYHADHSFLYVRRNQYVDKGENNTLYTPYFEMYDGVMDNYRLIEFKDCFLKNGYFQKVGDYPNDNDETDLYSLKEVDDICPRDEWNTCFGDNNDEFYLLRNGYLEIRPQWRQPTIPAGTENPYTPGRYNLKWWAQHVRHRFTRNCRSFQSAPMLYIKGGSDLGIMAYRSSKEYVSGLHVETMYFEFVAKYRFAPVVRDPSLIRVIPDAFYAGMGFGHNAKLMSFEQACDLGNTNGFKFDSEDSPCVYVTVGSSSRTVRDDSIAPENQTFIEPMSDDNWNICCRGAPTFGDQSKSDFGGVSFYANKFNWIVVDADEFVGTDTTFPISMQSILGHSRYPTSASSWASVMAMGPHGQEEGPKTRPIREYGMTTYGGDDK